MLWTFQSRSSALTDDEARYDCSSKNMVEKTIRAVYAQKKVGWFIEKLCLSYSMNNFLVLFLLLGAFQADHPSGDDGNSGLYEAMRKELRYAVDEIRMELEQVCCNSVNLLSNDWVVFLTYVVLAICWISLRCYTGRGKKNLCFSKW